MTNLEKLLIKHEGIRLKPYLDSVGKLTIGVGRNLDDVGISEDEALDMLREDIFQARKIVDALVPNAWALSEARRDALINMAFNLGGPRFSSFKKMIAAVNRQDFDEAARQALDSKWASQVGARAHELATMLKTGEYFK